MKKEKFNKFKLLTTFFVLVFSVVFISGLVFAACEDVCLDFDGDGYGSPASAVCDFPALDCDDFNPLVTFGVPELCFNAFDDDCDGLADCNDADCVGSPFCVIVGACNNNIICEPGEDCNNCPGDCGACPVTCPNGFCDLTCNECVTCPADCMGNVGCCGVGGCNTAIGECSSCVLDCNAIATNACCGNGFCDLIIGENALLCPGDCNCVDLDIDGYDTCAPGAPGALDAFPVDCDDNIFSCGANCFPGNLEICDGYDNNCNGTNDDGVGMNEENCSFLCPVFYDYNAARVGNFSCCGDDGGEGNPYEAAESFFCGDGNDNDCDGDIDMADSGCSGLCSTDNEREWPNILEPGDCNQCNDLLSEDNDGDQGADWPMADMCDADCQLDGALVTITVPFLNYEVNETSCNDIYDNDCDGNINCNDSDCAINPICACSDGTARNSCSVISGAPWYCNGAGNLVEGCGGAANCGCAGAWVCGPFNTFCCDNTCNGVCAPIGCDVASDPDCGCLGGDGCCGISCGALDPDCPPGCVPDGCNGNCPAGCNVAQDADCGCQNANACCGIGCNNTNDNDCAAGCVPDGCNGNCPAGCNVAQDADCGCQNANACCGIGCNNTNDNDCAAGCVPDGCNGNCPAGCNVAQDADCGCQNANACCGIGCNNTNDNDCAAGCVPDGCNGNCPAGCNVAQDADCGCQNANACCGIGCNNTNDNDCGLGACVFPFTFPCAL